MLEESLENLLLEAQEKIRDREQELIASTSGKYEKLRRLDDDTQAKDACEDVEEGKKESEGKGSEEKKEIGEVLCSRCKGMMEDRDDRERRKQ